MNPEDAVSRNPRWWEWLPALSGLALVLGVVWYASGYVSQTQDNAREIGELKAVNADHRLTALETWREAQGERK